MRRYYLMMRIPTKLKPESLERELRQFFKGKLCVFNTSARPEPYEEQRGDDDTWHHLDEPEGKNSRWDNIVNIIPLSGTYNAAMGKLRRKKGAEAPECMGGELIRSVCKTHLKAGNRRLAYGCWRFGGFVTLKSSGLLSKEDKPWSSRLRSYLPLSLECATNALEVLILEKDIRFATDTLTRSILPILSSSDVNLNREVEEWFVTPEAVVKVAIDISDHYKLCTEYATADEWIRLSDSLLMATKQPGDGVLAKRLAYHFAENRLSNLWYDFAHVEKRQCSDVNTLLRLDEAEGWLDYSILGLVAKPNTIGRVALALAKAAASILRFYVTRNSSYLGKASSVMRTARALVKAGRLGDPLGAGFVEEINSTFPYFDLIESEISSCRSGTLSAADFERAREAYRKLAAQPVCAKNTATLLNIIKCVEDSGEVVPINWRSKEDLAGFSMAANQVREILKKIAAKHISKLPSLNELRLPAQAMILGK